VLVRNDRVAFQLLQIESEICTKSLCLCIFTFAATDVLMYVGLINGAAMLPLTVGGKGVKPRTST